MARLDLYKCSKCGWGIYAPEKEKDYLMMGEMHFFMCKDCKEVFDTTVEHGTVERVENVRCPECGGANIVGWKPKDNCPKCGGRLEKQLGEGMFMD